MTIPEDVQNWLSDKGYGVVVSRIPTSGGCINSGMRLLTSSNSSFFLKINQTAPGDMFIKENQGLTILRIPGGPTVPKPFIYGPDFILMEDLNPSKKKANFWVSLGRKLVVIHDQVSTRFGFHSDNYIGSTKQENTWKDDGFAFFTENRLLFQSRLALENHLLTPHDHRMIESICSKLNVLIPPQRASLIHGDLWSGNVISDSEGSPAIIDPAVYYGWAEAELAMTALFGRFPNAFYRSYQESGQVENDYQSRFPIYNLYHLLNHLNLFGIGYLQSIRTIIKRFSN